MDNFLTELNDQEREAVARAMEILRDVGLEVGLTKMYQSQAQLAMIIMRPGSGGSANKVEAANENIEDPPLRRQ